MDRCLYGECSVHTGQDDPPNVVAQVDGTDGELCDMREERHHPRCAHRPPHQHYAAGLGPGARWRQVALNNQALDGLVQLARTVPHEHLEHLLSRVDLPRVGERLVGNGREKSALLRSVWNRSGVFAPVERDDADPIRSCEGLQLHEGA